MITITELAKKLGFKKGTVGYLHIEEALSLRKQGLEKELKDILNEYAISVRNAGNDSRYKEKQEEAIKKIISLI